MSKWAKQKFKDFASLQRGFDLPQQDRVDGVYPVVASTSITAFHNEYKVKGPCVTTGRSGALGEVLYIKKDCWPLNTTLWVKNFHGNDPRYVYYKLKTLGLEKFNAGAGVPTLNKNHLDTLEVLVHDIPTQSILASILSAYDDLIENNERRIKALEEMAQLLFTEWFVKFKFPGHEKIKLIDSGTSYGRIPQGWLVKKISQVADLVSRGPSLSYVKEGGIPVINQRCVRNGLIQWEAVQYAEPLQDSKKSLYIKKYDCLINSMGTGTLGRVSRNLNIIETAIIHNCITVVRATDSSLISPLLYYLIKSKENYFIASAIGATGQTSLKIETIGSLSILIPDNKVLSEFSELVLPIWDEIGCLLRFNDTLKFKRDLLIPQLVTGKRELKNI